MKVFKVCKACLSGRQVHKAEGMFDFGTTFGVTFDFSFWETFLNSSLSQQLIMLFAVGGWTVLAFLCLKGGSQVWVEYRQNTKGTKNWQWALLAVDIPALFIQTPKAVEQIFAHLSGATAHINVRDKFWLGKKQKWFSFEIISIEGYIQFLIRTEVEFRDLAEAAIYAQYTEAEITEVEDYVDNIPTKYPDKEYDVMGVEFKLADKDVYPIRTYENFEYQLSKDAVFSDPMAAILENFTRIGHGENLWMQLIVEPTDSSWKGEGIKIAKELMKGGPEEHHGGGIISAVGSIPQKIAQELINVVNWNFEGEHDAHDEKKKERVEISPGMKKTVESIEQKISKIVFKSKLRVLYAARKEAYSPNRCVEGFVGAINQFHMQNRNAIVPYMATHAHYDRRHKKSTILKNGFVKNFKKRKIKWRGSDGYILNIEELATIWHFPLPFVKAPLVQKAGAKRAEPPSGLPVEHSEGPLKRKPVSQPQSAPPQVMEPPPEELPYG